MRQISRQQAILMLEHAHYWKGQEREHAYLIRWALPSIAPPLKKLMQQWEHHFSLTANQAVELWRTMRRELEYSELLWQQHQAFTDYCERQSREWIRHLIRMQSDSKVIQNSAAARLFIDHLIRESEYYGLSNANYGLEQATASHHQEESLPSSADQHRTFIQPRAIILSKTNEGTWTMQSANDPKNGALTEVSFQQDTQQPLHLPEPSFALDALEPYLSATLVKTHYWGVYGNIIKALNQAKKQLNDETLRGEEMPMRCWQQKLERLETLHELHRLYWNALDPKGGGIPSGPIAHQLEADFGHFQQFRDHFTSYAMQEENGGWVILAWKPAAHRLVIHNMTANAPYSQWKVIPLLVLDMEEHAYMLQYETHRQEYIEAWWSLINWNRINERFVNARRLKHYPL